MRARTAAPCLVFTLTLIPPPQLAAFQVSYLRTDLWSSAKCDFMRRIAKAAPHSRVKGYIRKITEGNTKYQLAEVRVMHWCGGVGQMVGELTCVVVLP